MNKVNFINDFFTLTNVQVKVEAFYYSTYNSLGRISRKKKKTNLADCTAKFKISAKPELLRQPLVVQPHAFSTGAVSGKSAYDS
jgi:hypothetical protein